jgi:filamentous hemagglutinin family protein
MPPLIELTQKSKSKKSVSFWSLCCASIVFFFNGSVIAQVIPDSSLSTESSVIAPNLINGQPVEEITGGATRGENLFHSFESFSIPAGQSFYFLDPVGVTRIFSRVTDNMPSNIQATLGILGNSDLFLINSNGIIFGPDAQLQVGGLSLLQPLT